MKKILLRIILLLLIGLPCITCSLEPQQHYGLEQDTKTESVGSTELPDENFSISYPPACKVSKTSSLGNPSRYYHGNAANMNV